MALRITFLSFILVALQSCYKEKPEGKIIDSESSTLHNNLVASIDSVVMINGKKFKITIKQWDITEQLVTDDSVNVPAFACTIHVIDEKSHQVLRDSLLRDSWGYAGKISSIDRYQIAMPVFLVKDNTILFRCNIFCEDEDQITGEVLLDTSSGETRYEWREGYDYELSKSGSSQLIQNLDFAKVFSTTEQYQYRQNQV